MDQTMVHLTLAGMSEDGKRLLLVSDAGVEFTLDVDARLRSALRGETSRLGQLEITMESVLRPRDIQARIRAGESPEAVAEAAQTSVEKIMAFAGPVLAEREHVAQRAQRSSVRRRNDGARVLGEAVEAHLRSVNVGPDAVEWDSWRREDGRWTLSAGFATTTRTGSATFTFDLPGNYVVAEDDDARWLVGDRPTAPSAPAPQDDLEEVRRRRAAATDDATEGGGSADAGSDPVGRALGDDAIHMVSPAPIEAYLEPGLADADGHGSLDSTADPAPDQDTDQDSAPDQDTAPEPDAAPEPEGPAQPREDEPAARRPARKGRGRASVPSWDEIMFGSKD